MKYSLILATLSVIAVSCGNPHISSTDPRLETSTPPISTDVDDVSGETTAGQTTAGQTTAGQTTAGQTTAGQTTAGQTTAGSSAGTASGGGTGCIPGSTEVADYRFFFGSRSESEAGQTPADFSDFTKCRTVVSEDFNSFGSRSTKLITNSNSSTHSYQLKHQLQKNNLTGQESLLNDFFGTKTYYLFIENPVEQNGARGVDAGVDSRNVNSKTKTVLVWSFSSPVAYWGSNVLDVESSPTEPAILRIFDCNKTLLKQANVIYPDNEQGQKERHFIGVISAYSNICHVSLTVGDYEKTPPSSSRVFYRAIAVDDFTYGK